MNQAFRTTLLLGILTALVLLAGYAVGGRSGMVTAFFLSLCMNFGSYWFSDAIVLSMHGAKELGKTENPQLHDIVSKLAARANIREPKIYLFETTDPNAFATGRDANHAAIAVSTGLLAIMSSREVEGVLAHELSHVKNHDMLISSIAATLAGAISILGNMLYGFGSFGFSRNSEREDRTNPMIAMLFILLAPLIAMIVQLAVSRSREYAADESGARLAGNTDGLASALTKLGQFVKRVRIDPSPVQSSAVHMYFSNNFSGQSLLQLFSTHPPLVERIKRLKALKV